MPNWTAIKKRLEVSKDEDAVYEVDSLTNRDIIPIPPERRTWTPFAFAMYWFIEGISVSGYTTGSTLVGFGLSVKQSIACCVAAGIMYGWMAVVLGWIGSHHHIGFPLISRFMFGINGAPFGIILRTITGIIWWGVQAVYGGQAIRVVIGAMSPSFLDWDTFHNKNDITSNDLVGLVLYCIFMIPCLRIAPEKLHFFFRIVTIFTIGAFFGLIGFCTRKAGGAGSMFNAPSEEFSTRGDLAWACVKGIFSVLGTTGTGILGQSDFTRYASTKRAPVLSQFLGAPLALTFSSILGVITTSAAKDVVGDTIWNPVLLLSAIQQHQGNSSQVRVAVFFGGLAFVLQQLAINLLLNTLSSSMDMVGLLPKYINITRGSFMVMIIGILIWPWKILSSARAVVVFGNGWGCFCSAQTGGIIARYFITYRRKVILKDLYIRSDESIYWFWGGYDWRSFVSFFVGTVFLLPGLGADVNFKTIGFWSYIYELSYAWGLLISGATLIALEYIFPGKTISPTSKVDDVYTEDGTPLETLDMSSSVEEVNVHVEGKAASIKEAEV